MTPLLRYRNPGAAARWLCEAFGFREHDSAQEFDQHVKYILLALGDSSVLVRPVSNSVFDDLMVEPSAVGGANTHVLYVTIPDAEAHCRQAKAAGAKVELEPQDDGLGGRFYTCRDPEGHLWSFGTNSYGRSGSMPASWQPDARVPAVVGLQAASGAQQSAPDPASQPDGRSHPCRAGGRLDALRKLYAQFLPGHGHDDGRRRTQRRQKRANAA